MKANNKYTTGRSTRHFLPIQITLPVRNPGRAFTPEIAKALTKYIESYFEKTHVPLLDVSAKPKYITAKFLMSPDMCVGTFCARFKGSMTQILKRDFPDYANIGPIWEKSYMLTGANDDYQLCLNQYFAECGMPDAQKESFEPMEAEGADAHV